MKNLTEKHWFYICTIIAVLGFTLAVIGAIKASHAQGLTTSSINRVSIYSAEGYHANTYATARNLTTATQIPTNNFLVGQSNNNPECCVRRTYLSFAIPNMISVSACSLCVYNNGGTISSGNEFYLRIFGARSSKPVYDLDDFPRFNGWAASGSYTGTVLNNNFYVASTWTSSTWNKTDFNAAGLDSVFAARNDTLWIVLLSSKDVSSTDPTAGKQEWINILNTSYIPHLSITYTAPSTVKMRKYLYDKDPFYLWQNGESTPLYKK